MTLHLTAFAVLFLLSAVQASEKNQTGLYTIIGSQQLSYHRSYYVSVSVQNTTEPVIVRLKLVHEANETEIEIVRQVTVQPWTTELVEFETGTLESKPNSFYRLIADGIDKIDFHNETDLTLSEKYFSFLIQTDKALYKPGDLVRFRVVVIDKDTKPHDLIDTLQVNVYDGAGNRIKLFANQSTAHGVYTNEFPLSESPVVGHWKLTFISGSEKKSRSFEVGEYVLPTFEVFLETPEHVLYADKIIRANVRGKYTFGKAVHGQANCTASWNGKHVNKLVKVTTKGSLEIDFVDELGVYYGTSDYILLECALEEEFTGRKQSTSTSIRVHRFRYSIVRQSYYYTYFDGRPFEFDVRAQLYDGTPIRNEPLEIWWSTDLSAADGIGSTTVQTNGEGVASVRLTFPEGKVTVYLMAKYKDHAEGLGHFTSSIYRGREATLPEFQLKANDTDIFVGGTVKMHLVSRVPLKHFTYQVFGRGNVLISKSQTVPEQTNIEFDFPATFDMVPNVQVVVYTIRDDGNVNTASQTVFLQKKLPNQITLESAVNETEPGTEYSLKIVTAPNSYVGLLAVDQSVLLMRSGNDLSVDDVMRELDRYGDDVMQHQSERYHQRYYWSRPISTIENAGMFILSNVKDFIPIPIEKVEEDRYSTMLQYEQHSDRVGSPPGSSAFYASNRKSMLNNAQSAIRKDFPETWIWEGLRVKGEQHFTKRVPDTITSWVITAFSVNADNGLGLTKEPTKMTTFKSFFLTVSLPYSVKRGEILSIPVTIFNYLDSTVNADVTFFNDDNEFEFVDLNDEANEIVNADSRRQRHVSVKSKDTSGLFFSIRPLQVGQITIKIIVESAVAGDGVQRILLVTPEGVPQYANTALMLNLSDNGKAVEHEFSIDLPEHTVPDSTFIQITAVGDLLGPSVKNLGRLIYMPSGCGEQNMLKFVPNIVVRNYLQAINQLTDDLEEKTRLNLEIGYQRQLSYRHSGGSFSAFGRQDRRGSTWLTAFVARSFQQASKHIDIEPRIINEALNFLNKTQSENGSFPEYGDVIHRQIQGGGDKNVALTAYTLIAFLENREAFPEYENNIKRATEFIVQHLDILDDVYSMSLAAYALQLAKDSNKDLLLRDLNAKVITESDLKHWSVRKSEGTKYHPNSIDTEITGYAMLANLLADRTDDVVPVLKWLLSQRNERGGFHSTQDTIVGLEAIATVAGRVTASSADNDVKVDLTFEGNSTSFEVNSGNAQVFQQLQIPSQVRKINVKAFGTGFTLLSLSYKYYVNESAALPRFTIEPAVKPTTYPNLLKFEACVAFIPNAAADGGGASESNMAVMEIDLPSGYQFDADQRQTLQRTQSVKKLETRNDDTQIILYFEHLTTVQICPQIKAIRTHKVAHQKPAAIVVYDYYDTARKSRVFYNADEKSLCDICENNCPDKCNA
ncbi:CD109 antigen-like [Bradysia coprophila]|uniref:CD109 antigen-like n=1 Tax=Bradysia coprophila TaxID=38358 RepID=UPI00187DD8F1|nr:CD109 antigen-like [Bradysia coprophila]